jgi:hypothetical protein
MLQPDQERLFIYATNKKLPALGAALKPQPRQMVSFADGDTISSSSRFHMLSCDTPEKESFAGRAETAIPSSFSRSRICRLSGDWETIEAQRRLRDVQLLGNGNEVTKMAPFRLDSCQRGGKFFWPVDADVPPRSDAFMHNSASVRWSRGKYPRQRAKENNVQSVAR